jgi:hypothetical protein
MPIAGGDELRRVDPAAQSFRRRVDPAAQSARLRSRPGGASKMSLE